MEISVPRFVGHWSSLRNDFMLDHMYWRLPEVVESLDLSLGPLCVSAGDEIDSYISAHELEIGASSFQAVVR
jgi:hypothetical protein